MTAYPRLTLEIYPTPALTTLALVPDPAAPDPIGACGDLPLVTAAIRDGQIGEWRVRDLRRTKNGQAYITMTVDGQTRMAVFESLETRDGALPESLTGALPGVRPSALIRAVRGPAAASLTRHLGRHADLIPCSGLGDWRVYALALRGTPRARPAPQTSRPRHAVWL
jgi:hypothetical protein